MSEFYVNWTKEKFQGCIQSFMLPWKLRKRQILLVNQNLSLVYFSPAKFQLVSCNLPLAMIWQMTYTHKLPKLCSATLIQWDESNTNDNRSSSFCFLERKRSQNGIWVLETNTLKKKKCISDHESKKDWSGLNRKLQKRGSSIIQSINEKEPLAWN